MNTHSKTQVIKTSCSLCHTGCGVLVHLEKGKVVKIEGNPDSIKTVNDVWKFSKNMWSQDPTWYLVETSNK